MLPIKNYPGYFVFSTGKLWSRKRKRFLKPIRAKGGYYRITLSDDGRRHSHLIHRLILETFIGPCPGGMECRHLNGNPQDNRLQNLCWGTRKENRADARKHGTLSCGEHQYNAKLTELKVKMIRSLHKFGQFSQEGLGELFSVSQYCIWSIVNRKTWKHI